MQLAALFAADRRRTTGGTFAGLRAAARALRHRCGVAWMIANLLLHWLLLRVDCFARLGVVSSSGSGTLLSNASESSSGAAAVLSGDDGDLSTLPTIAWPPACTFTCSTVIFCWPRPRCLASAFICRRYLRELRSVFAIEITTVERLVRKHCALQALHGGFVDRYHLRREHALQGVGGRNGFKISERSGNRRLLILALMKPERTKSLVDRMFLQRFVIGAGVNFQYSAKQSWLPGGVIARGSSVDCDSAQILHESQLCARGRAHSKIRLEFEPARLSLNFRCLFDK